jgi:hypothetical protein
MPPLLTLPPGFANPKTWLGSGQWHVTARDDAFLRARTEGLDAYLSGLFIVLAAGGGGGLAAAGEVRDFLLWEQRAELHNLSTRTADNPPARVEVERRRAIVAARRAAEAQARGPRNPRPPPAQPPGGAAGEGVGGASGALDAPDQAQPPRQERAAREGGPGPGGRPPRAPREFRERREPRPARNPGAPTDRADRPDRSTRPTRPDRPGHRGPDRAHGPQRDARTPRQDLRAEGYQPRPHPETPHVQAPGPLPDDPARRERALLLRTYEASPLTKANFCVLKRITEAELDAQLALARQERGPARPRP